MRRFLLVLVMVSLLGGCAHKPGVGSYLDASTTFLALNSGDFVEANPLLSWGPTPAATALASIGLKQGVKYALSESGATDEATAHRAVETGGVAAGVWNTGLLVGASSLMSVVGGFGAAYLYWLWTGGEL